MDAAVLNRSGDALDRALARADLYRELAAGLRDPDGPQAAAVDPDVVVEAAEALGLSLSATEGSAIRGAADPAVRARQHRELFGHVVAQGCPPYETEYGRRHVFGQAQELADIAAFYNAFGLATAAGGERVDHVATELEFLAVLGLKEALALAREEADPAERARSAAAGFLRDHAGRWIPALAALIEQRAPEGAYAALTGLAAALVEGHGRELGVEPEALGPGDLRPILEEPDGFAFECGVDADDDIPR
jgi:TorA maturation chaperone TorD